MPWAESFSQPRIHCGDRWSGVEIIILVELKASQEFILCFSSTYQIACIINGLMGHSTGRGPDLPGTQLATNLLARGYFQKHPVPFTGHLIMKSHKDGTVVGIL